MIQLFSSRAACLFPLFVAIAPASHGGQLNDTGITQCANNTENDLTCPVTGFPRQDAQLGRDAKAAQGTLTKIGGGHAGFDFTKLDAAGNPLPASATKWVCVRDNVTQRVWENKTNNGGLRDRDNTYTWYKPDPKTNGGNAGTQDGGVCTGSACDTDAYAKAVNAVKLCGFSNWRLPTIEELHSLLNLSVPFPGPTIDSDYFSNGLDDIFWSTSPYVSASDAWTVHFYAGYDTPSNKGEAYAVRLVRGGQ